MLENLSCTCEAAGCDQPLSPEECMLVFQTEEGKRRAYECDCGAVTITVSR